MPVGAGADQEPDHLGQAGVQVAVIAGATAWVFHYPRRGRQFPVVNGKTLDAQAHQLRITMSSNWPV
jgi:hypothetical protein